MSWDDKAACRNADPELFFPDVEHPASAETKMATRFCAVCKIRRACLRKALSQPVGKDFGIWGGTTRSQRKEIREARAQQLEASDA